MISRLGFAFLMVLILLFPSAPAASAEKTHSDFRLLEQGCYTFTDKLFESNPNEVLYTSPILTSKPLPDAFGGKSFLKVSCDAPHHLQIASVRTSQVKSSLRMDGIPLKSLCIIDNIRSQNAGHSRHTTQTYFRVYRQAVSKKNISFCGVIAPSFLHPSNSDYKIYEAFTTPHLKIKGL